MFNVGGLAPLAVGLVALVVLGPDKLPAALRQAGALLGQLRRMSDGFRIDVTAALADDGGEPARTEPVAAESRVD